MKGYPKSRFEIADETSFVDIPTDSSDTGVIPIYMGTYSSDKGPEDWRMITSLDSFISECGVVSYVRHGQAQLQIAEALRSGAYVFAKRIVSDDAKLANVTINATVVNSNKVSYLYFSATTDDAVTLNDAVLSGYNNFDSTKDPEEYKTPSESEGSSGDHSASTHVDDLGGATDAPKSTIITIPLFTITANGRGVSAISFNIIPQYSISKGSQYVKYDLQIIENNKIIDDVIFCMNPNKIIDGANQSIETKVTNMTNQIQCKVYEDGINKLVVELAKTATFGTTTVSDNGKASTVPTPLPANKLIDFDFINGKNIRGNESIGGIVTIDSANSEGTDLWSVNKPTSIKDAIVDLQAVEGIPLASGSYGKLGYAPVTKGVYSDEYKDLTLLAYDVDPKGKIAHPGDPIIYDLDNYAIDAIFDADFDYDIKKAIINLVDYRGDCVFIADLGIHAKDKSEGGLKEDVNVLTKQGILDATSRLPYSKFTAIYGQYANTVDPFTKKEITVTFPYLLTSKMTSHIASGVGTPFAGMINGLTFPEVIDSSVSFIPCTIPDEDQKQDFVDANVNYACYYNGLLTMDTMYTNQDDYTKLSYLHNVMLVQEVIKVIRSKCPSSRYRFMEGSDLEDYITDASTIINEYKTYFDSISIKYMADETYESNNIFYATIKVKFKNFVQEEYFKVIAIN